MARTKSKFSQSALQASETKPTSDLEGLRSVVADAPLLVFALDTDGRFYVAEGRGIALLNKVHVPLLGAHFQDLTESYPELTELIARGMSGSPALQSIRLTSRIFEISVMPIFSSDGSMQSLHGYGIDITDRRLTQDALEKQQDFFRQVIDINPNFIFAKDRAGAFILVNDAVAKAYGTSVEDLIGKTDADFNPNVDEVEQFRRDDLSVLDSGEERFIAEEVITDADGSKRYLQTTKRPVLGADNNSDFVLGVSTDISRRKAIETMLQRRLDFERVLSSISTSFISLPFEEMDAGIVEALERIGSFLEIDRCNLVLLRADKRIGDGSHEWCAKDAPSVTEEMQALHSDNFPWFSSHLAQGKSLSIEDTAFLPEEASAEAAYLQQHKVRAMLSIPLLFEHKPVGFIVLQSLKEPRSWSADAEGMLRLLSEIFVNAIERRRVIEVRRRSMERTERLREVAEKLNVADALSDIYDISIEAILATLNADRASLLLLDDDGQLRHKSSFGLSYSYTQRISPYSPWPENETEAEPVFFENVEYSELDEWLKDSIRREGFASCGFFPLMGKEKIIGRLMVYFDTPHQFTADEINVGRVLSTNISAAVRRVISRNALLKSEELYRQFFEDDLTGDFIATADGTIIECNDAFAAIFGFTSPQDAMKHSMTVLHGDELSRQQHLKEIRKHGSLSMHEVELRRLDGEIVHIIQNVRGEFDEDGNLLRTRGYLFDITERKIAEQRLREHAALLDNTQDAIILHDLDDRILFWNDAAERLYGWSDTDALNERMHALIPGLSTDEADDALRQLLLSNKWRREIKQYTRDGQELIIDSRRTLIRDGRGRPKSVLVVNSNISSQKKWEEERHRASKLQSVGLLAGGIAHDFNNILTAILGNLSLVKAGTEEGSSQHTRLTRAETAAARAQDLTQQLLTFAKGGAPIKQAASVGDLVRETADFALRGANCKVAFDIPDDLWAAEIDSGQISQVINNLVINASHAMPHGGTVQINCRNIINDPEQEEGIVALKAGRFVHISVIDHGKGIAAGDLDKIFDPYFTTKDGGTGLGLATTYSIIRKHLGYIFVDSEESIGTQFDIFLPANPSVVPAKERDVPSLTRANGERVLIMDDDETIREIVGSMLEELGYAPDYARDGMEALTSYEVAMRSDTPFSAVIMDLTIPGGMGGKETIQRLLELDPSACAIVSSGYSNDPIMADYLSYGFRSVVAKPFQLHELSEALCAALPHIKVQNNQT